MHIYYIAYCSKPITVGVLYTPPNQKNFLENFSESLSKLNLENNEVYFLGDLNIIHGEYVFDELKNSCLDTVSSDIKRYIEICAACGLKQIIKAPTRITCNTSTLIDHILSSSNVKISHSGVIDIGLSDHHLILCTRKINKTRVNKHTQITHRSYKNYTV